LPHQDFSYLEHTLLTSPDTKTPSQIVHVLIDAFPIQNGLKQGDVLSSLLFNFALEYAIRKVQEWMEHICSWSVLMMLICWVKT